MDLQVLKQNFCELRMRTEEALGKLHRDEFLTEEETERLVVAARRLQESQAAFSEEFGVEGEVLFGSLREIEKAVSDRESRLQAEKLSRLKVALEEFLRLVSPDDDAAQRLAVAQTEAKTLLHGEEAALCAADAEPYEVANRAAGEKEDSVRKDIVKPHRKLLGKKFGAEFVSDLLFGLIQAEDGPVEQSVSETEEEHTKASASITEEDALPEEVTEAPNDLAETLVPETKQPNPAEIIKGSDEKTTETSIPEAKEEPVEEPALEMEEELVPEESIEESAEVSAEMIEESTEIPEEPEMPAETTQDQDDGRAETLARQLIESHIEPSETEPYLNLIDRLLTQGETAIATALAYALKKYGGQNEWAKTYANVEETLKYALGFGADGVSPDYNYAAICERFCPEGEWQFAARVCAYARALTQPNDTVDFSLLNNEAKPLIKGDGWDGFEKWKQAFNALCDLLTDAPFAFSADTRTKLAAKKDRANALKNCAEEAKKLLAEFNTKYNAKRAPEFMPLYRDFASGGWVYKLVKPIADCKDETGADVAEARAFCAKFCDGDGNFLEKEADEYFTAMGQQIGLQQKLYGPIKESLLTLIEEGVRLIGKWLSIVEGDAGGKIERIEKGRGRIAALLKEAAESLQNEPSASLFKETAEDLSALLSGEERPRRDFSAFLQTDVLVLGEKMLPEFPIFESKVTELRGYYRVLLHIAAEKDALDEETVQRRIERDNLGMAQQICERQHLGVKLPDDKNPKLDCEKHCSELKADLDMGFMRGHIEALFQSISLKEMETVYSHCCKSKNYGLCEEFFKALRKAADEEKALRAKTLKAEFETFAAGKSEEEYPILNAISEQLDEENYAVAEVFLNQARRDEVRIDDDTLDEEDVHGQFLECCDTIFNFFKEYKWNRNTTQSLRQDGEKASRAFGRPDLGQEGVKRAVDMLERAMRSGGKAWGKEFLEDLGFSVREKKGIVKEENGILLEHYEMTPLSNALLTYDHPIGAFGTQLKELMLLRIGNEKGQITVVLQQYANALKGRPVVVFFDGEMTKPQRRKLAGQLKKDFSSQPYLVVDRVLCAFLAGSGGRRLSATLKCTLPYTYLNPYCVNGSGDIPSEMFFGRTNEQNNLFNMQNNLSLVCGGRQLGKTALLKRVAEIAHVPRKKHFAVSCGKSEANRKEVLDELIKKLAPIGLDVGDISDWETLRDHIVGWHKNGSFRQLIFFIDEGDAFLAEDRADGYRALQCLTAAVKETKHDFKFILAGLHNIARESHSNNGFALQLGEPCVVRPFTPREARRLVELPLLYLGFRFENERLLPGILSHANYYPGLLHLFCSNLLTYLRENYTRYFNEQNNPPFVIEDRHIGAILSDAAAEASGFNSAVKDRFDATLDLDPRYRLLALAMCILYRDKEGQVGYSAEEVLEYVGAALPGGAEFEARECENLLREMCDLGVLSIVKEEGSEVKFVFLRHVFYEYVSGVGRGTDELYKMLEMRAKEVVA